MARDAILGHGFVWPDGLPSCTVCDRMANDPIHVTPSRASVMPWGNTRLLARAEGNPGGPKPTAPHAYTTRGGVTSLVPCVACQEKLGSSVHLVGAPAGMVAPRATVIPEPPTLAGEAPVVVEGRNRFVLATKAAGVVDVAEELWQNVRQVSAANSPHLWISGRYVGADEPNRNAAYWSTGDLEMGEPTVAHGPVNWLHEERHVIGAIAGSRMVHREVAAEGDPGNHIVALGAVWPWIYPDEARVIAQASEAGSLWFSMECISREVSCLGADDCQHTMSYRDYMLDQDSRCEHMKDGGTRRLIDPIFQGVGIIVPPVRPGWALADARVTAAESEQLVERQAAAFVGTADEDAVVVASHLLASAG